MITSLPRSRPRRMRAFSLIELMIAIVILGFGMAMAATMFPVGWSRARVLAENDARLAMVDNALTQFTQTAAVDGFDSDRSTFVGDLVVLTPPLVVVETVVARGDQLVHALNMENRLVNGQIVPEIAVEGERLDRKEFHVPVGDIPVDLVANSFFTPRVRFDDRWYPQLRQRRGTVEDRTDPTTDRAWEDTLDSRHHSWAVLHRARTQIGTPAVQNPAVDPALTEADEAAVSKSRAFDLFFVSLRRGRSTLRFPQQDPSAGNTPNPLVRETVVAPKALDPEFDTVLPTAWRVQVYFNPEILNEAAEATGVPTEIQVPPPSAGGSYPNFVIDMFPEGAYMIDEVDGQVFRVVGRRVVIGSGSGGDTAYLTLDREVTSEELDDGEFQGAMPVQIQPDEATRTMWVYPPACEPERGTGDAPVFSGANPVIGIDVRTIHVAPHK